MLKLSRGETPSPPFSFGTTNLWRWYFPGSGLGFSFVGHAIVATLLLMIPAPPRVEEEKQPWELSGMPDPDRERVVMYLPTLRDGGGRAGGGPGGDGRPGGSSGRSGGGEEQGGGESGGSGESESPLVEPPDPRPRRQYPGPQVVISDFPDPTSSMQTLLQPELEDLPVLGEARNLPNVVSLSSLGLAPEPGPPVVPPRPRLEPLAEDVQVIETSEFVMPRPVTPDVEELPASRRMPNLNTPAPLPPTELAPLTGSSELGVRLADPFDPEMQPLDTVRGAATEAVELDREGPPNLRSPLDLPELPTLTARATVPQSGPTQTVGEVPQEVGATPPAPAAEDGPDPREPEPAEALEGSGARPGGGTELGKVLSLSPFPTVGEPVGIPAAEARGRFAISPEPGLESSETEPGPEGSGGGGGTGSSGSGPGSGTGQGPGTGGGSGSGPGSGSGTGTGPGSGSGSGSGLGPGSGTGTGTGIGSGTGPGSGPGTGPGAGSGGGTGSGSGSGSGPGSGLGSGSGTGSGSGSGTGSGPFPGIRIVGGVGNAPTPGSRVSRPPDRMGGVRVVGGVDDSSAVAAAAGRPMPDPRTDATPLPERPRYGAFVISTESSGGGLPSFGVFSDEHVHTVYLDVKERLTDPAPPWIFEFGGPRRTAVQADRLGKDGQLSPGFVLPVPSFKQRPELPREVVEMHLGKMIVVFGVVNAEGRLEQMSVKDSPDPVLNPLVLEALGRWEFQPGTLDGEPVAVKTLLGIPLWLP